MKIFKTTVQAILLLPAVLILYFNVKLFYSPSIKNNINQAVLSQLQYLKKALREQEAARDMQLIFPEGFVFSNVLYGLAWVDLIEKIPKETLEYKEGNQEILWAIDQLLSKDGYDIFNESLPLSHGAFYKGWTTFLIGQFLKLNPDNDFGFFKIYDTHCQQISAAIQNTKSPYLESYAGMTWPADNILCLASLVQHDKIYPPQFRNTIDTWLNRIKIHLDSTTQLIPHAFDLATNEGTQGARGSSQSLMLSFLPEIDSVFARQQFQKYKKHFIDYKLGLPAVREYPLGNDNKGDIDSGPVIWGVGAAASIVAIKAMGENKDATYFYPIRNTIEAFGMPLKTNGGKHYLFGKLIIADTFIAWCNAKNYDFNNSSAGFWQFKFLLISLIIVVLWGFYVYKL